MADAASTTPHRRPSATSTNHHPESGRTPPFHHRRRRRFGRRRTRTRWHCFGTRASHRRAAQSNLKLPQRRRSSTGARCRPQRQDAIAALLCIAIRRGGACSDRAPPALKSAAEPHCHATESRARPPHQSRHRGSDDPSRMVGAGASRRKDGRCRRQASRRLSRAPTSPPRRSALSAALPARRLTPSYASVAALPSR